MIVSAMIPQITLTELWQHVSNSILQLALLGGLLGHLEKVNERTRAYEVTC
jgi:hypothetical protein